MESNAHERCLRHLRRQAVLVASLLFFGCFLTDVLAVHIFVEPVHRWLREPGRVALMLVANILRLAVCAGVGWLMWSRAERQHELLHFRMQQENALHELNHHVRNALTQALYAAHVTGDQETLRLMEQAVDRIIASLRQASDLNPKLLRARLYVESRFAKSDEPLAIAAAASDD